VLDSRYWQDRNYIRYYFAVNGPIRFRPFSKRKTNIQVPETMRAFTEANIKVWILTGDKQEAAVCVGLSTSLIAPNSPIVVFDQTEHTVNAVIDYYR